MKPKRVAPEDARILAIDTTTRTLAIGITDGKRSAGFTLETANKLSTMLVPLIGQVMDAFGMKLQDVDYFACGQGPGSFTGIRIGMAAMKGLSFSLGKPLIGLPTQDILALSAVDWLRHHPAAVTAVYCACVDAKRNSVYTTLYKVRYHGAKRESPFRLLEKEKFLGVLDKRKRLLKKSNAPAPVVFSGDGLLLYTDEIRRILPDAVFLDKDCWHPQPRHLIAGARRLIEEKEVGTAENIKPIYLYSDECQIKAQKNGKKKA